MMVEDSQVHRIRTARSGFFLPEASPWDTVAMGDVLGQVVDPSTGALQETVLAPLAGKVLAVREQPVVFSGSMVVRMVEQVDE
jgi:predicted deacylase